MRVLNSMKIEAKVSEVLFTLKDNRSKHHAVVLEARAGYLKAARAELERRLKQLESGKIVALRFTLATPLDYTDVYDTAIAMLEMHKQPTVILDSDQVRSLIQDQWDWTRDWVATNSSYSQSARALVTGEDD
jgi:hypothetical protein